MGKWYSVGDEAINKYKEYLKNKQDSPSYPNGGGYVRRFWIPQGQVKKVTFLDDPEFMCSEHRTQSKYGPRFFTCIAELGPQGGCPLCNSENRAYLSFFATAIDHTEWIDRKGQKHQYEKTLISFKGKAIKRILELVEETEGGLKYLTVSMERGPERNSLSCGELFKVSAKGRLSEAALKKVIPSTETLEPFDYATILALKTPEELRRIVGGEMPIGSSADEDPFSDFSDEKKEKLADLDSLEDLL